MTTINRATWTDDDGSGMTGTILNNARLQGDIYDKVDAALATIDGKDASQDTAIAANGPHSILSAQHPDTTPAALVTGDLLVVGAGAKLARLPKATDGQLLSLVSGAPAWANSPVGQWQTYAYAAGNLTTATGTFTVPVAAGNWDFRYLIIGKLAVISVAINNGVTSAATAYVRITLPPGLSPAITNQNLMGTVYPGTTLTATCINLSTALGGIVTWYANVAQSGTIPATTVLSLNASLFYALP